MRSHKDKLKELFMYLPNRYQKEVRKELKLEDSSSNKVKIWRVRNGITEDSLIEASLIKIAKREKRQILKNKQALDQA